MMPMAKPLPPPPGRNRPLWEGLHYVQCTSEGRPIASAVIADELLYLAERLVPLEAEPVNNYAGDDPTWTRWDERRRLRNRLKLEARKADMAFRNPERRE